MKKIEQILKSFLMNILLLFRFRKKNVEIDFNDPHSKVLLIRLNRIGDALVTTPFIDLLRKHINAKIYVLADRKNHFVFDDNPSIDKVIIFKKGLNGIIEFVRLIKNENINTVVDLHDDVSTTVSFLIALCGARNKFGLQKENKNIYTKTVEKLDPAAHHVVERNLQLAELFNIKPNFGEAVIHFYPGKEAINFVENKLNSCFFEKKKMIGINISAGSSARFWGIDNYKKIAVFLNSIGFNVLIISSPGDFETGKKIAGDKFALFCSEKFAEFAAAIKKMDMLFTPDTAAVHLAAAFHIPVFGLYVKYNTSDMIWSPIGSDFSCVITTEQNLDNVDYVEVENKLNLFIKKVFSI